VYQVDAGAFAPADAWPARDAHTPSVARLSKRRVLRAIAAIAFVAINGVVMHAWLAGDARGTRLRTEQHSTQTELNGHRAALSMLNARAREARASLEALTAHRDTLVGKTASAGAATVAARSRSNTERQRAAARQARINSLSGCLAALNKAMNTLSVGDSVNGEPAVAKLAVACAGAK
jgi:hypothetical protein